VKKIRTKTDLHIKHKESRLKKKVLVGMMSLAGVLALSGCFGDDATIKDDTKDASVQVTKESIKEVDTIAKEIDKSEVVKDIKSLETSPEEITPDVKDDSVQDTNETVEKVEAVLEEAVDGEVKKIEEELNSTTPAQAPVSANENGSSANGAEIYKKCVACHGQKAELKALGKSEVIAGWSSDKIFADLEGYKNGTINKYGMATTMKGIVTPLSKDDLRAVSDYISKL